MQIVFITGISKGIGKALALKFLQENFFVIGTSTTGKVDVNHENLLIIPLDLSSSESIAKCTEQVSGLNKKINIVINSAGVLLDENQNTIVPDLLRKTLEVNVIGTADLTERIIPYVADGGHLINISSRMGSLSMIGFGDTSVDAPAYRISKTALNMYTRTLAVRLQGKVTVSSIHPGWVRTQMGGEGADLSPEDAAAHIYTFALTQPESGNFWFNGRKMPW